MFIHITEIGKGVLKAIPAPSSSKSDCCIISSNKALTQKHIDKIVIVNVDQSALLFHI